MEGDQTKLLITQIKRTDTNKADLFAKGRKFKDTTLFDLSELAEVGMDYESLPVGQLVPCRFWAHVKESSKLNQSGNPYLDVVFLEPVETGNSSQGSGDLGDVGAVLDDILTELRAIRAVMSRFAPSQVQVHSGPAHVNPVRVLYQDPEPKSERSPQGQEAEEVPDTWPEERAELPQATRSPETHQARPSEDPELMDDDKARRLFSTLAGPAIRDRKVAADYVNGLTRDAVKTGWRDAYFALAAEINKSVRTAGSQSAVAVG